VAHPSFEESCGVCRRLAAPESAPLFETELWQVHPIEAPAGVPGWMVLYAKRHVAGAPQFSDAEARSLGPTLQHLTSRLLEVTGALRVYLAAMGESSPHFHMHLVPRYADMPKGAKGWGVFDLQRAAAAGEITTDPKEVAALAQRYRERLQGDPASP
jgi:diadenosine tetraphosphate (Ap4A) HIT family hydrolase